MQFFELLFCLPGHIENRLLIIYKKVVIIKRGVQLLIHPVNDTCLNNRRLYAVHTMYMYMYMYSFELSSQFTFNISG